MKYLIRLVCEIYSATKNFSRISAISFFRLHVLICLFINPKEQLLGIAWLHHFCQCACMMARPFNACNIAAWMSLIFIQMVLHKWCSQGMPCTIQPYTKFNRESNSGPHAFKPHVAICNQIQIVLINQHDTPLSDWLVICNFQ